MDNEIEEEAAYLDDNDSEGGEEIGYAYLGFVEKPENSTSLLRHSMPSKAGGFPAWLDPVNLPSGRSLLCDICEEPLKFLLQVYAPDEEMENTFHRTLFVFICPSMACLRDDQEGQKIRHPQNPYRSVKVFRCQLQQNNPFYPPINNGHPSTVGSELCTWCGTWRGIKRCPSCQTAIYCSEKHQVKHSQEGHDYDCQRIAHHNEIVPVELPKAACPTIWPAFKIAEVREEEFGAQMSLMQEFEGADDKSWASFQQHISWAPEQVLRYCRDTDAKPLWPKASGRLDGVDIPPCRHCGGPLLFEFRILPQLLYYLRVSNYVDSIDWAIITVYTCEASCQANLAYKEEYAWVQLAD